MSANNRIYVEITNSPCAAKGLVSYRAHGRFGWIMIGASDDEDAMREAKRSTPNPTDLQVWDGRAYVPVSIKVQS